MKTLFNEELNKYEINNLKQIFDIKDFFSEPVENHWFAIVKFKNSNTKDLIYLFGNNNKEITTIMLLNPDFETVKKDVNIKTENLALLKLTITALMSLRKKKSLK